LGGRLRVAKGELKAIFTNLRREGYTIVGPRLKEGAVLFDELESADELPIGYMDHQEPGRYRVEREGDLYFSYTNGPNSPKNFLHPPRLELLRVLRGRRGIWLEPVEWEVRRYAFVGVRACDVAALRILDRVLLGSEYVDEYYRGVRAGVFLLAVNCTRAGGSCFCASLGTGPAVREGYDLLLTELEDSFLVEVGSDRGRVALAGVEARVATPEEVAEAEALVEAAARSMARAVETEGLREALYARLESPAWAEVGARCTACGSCTMVCPTCFCFDLLEVNELDGRSSTRVRIWDTCFNIEFAEIAGLNVRRSVKSRYRQWLMHKMAYWVDQFGMLGCVGCGRCVTWCPMAIDITEEVRRIRA